jgi:AcrR family transcriptional regulator
MGWREEKKQLQRVEIVQAALELLRERGYDETRVRDISARAGISEATFFNYFPAKDLVLDELALAQVELFRAGLRQQLGVEGKSVPARIAEQLRAASSAIEAERDFHTVLWTRSNLLRSSGALRARTQELYCALAALFELGQQRGEIDRARSPMQLAELLIAIYHFTTINWLLGAYDGREPREALAARVAAALEVFLGGCGALKDA